MFNEAQDRLEKTPMASTIVVNGELRNFKIRFVLFHNGRICQNRKENRSKKNLPEV